MYLEEKKRMCFYKTYIFFLSSLFHPFSNISSRFVKYVTRSISFIIRLMILSESRRMNFYPLIVINRE